jgi:hypothetical protein
MPIRSAIMSNVTNQSNPTKSKSDFPGQVSSMADRAKDGAASFADRAKDGASQLADRTKEAAESLVDRTKEGAAYAADRARSAASSAMHTAEDAACYAGNKAEDATHAVGGSLRQMGLESAGRYLEEEGLQGIAEDVTTLIRRNPVPALFIAMGVGFLMAKAMSGSRS